MRPREFTCEICEQEYVSDVTDVKAMKEYKQKFGKHLREEIAFVCADCIIEFEKWCAVVSKNE